jgi:O-antigen ligase
MIVVMFLVLTVHLDLNSIFIQSLEERMLYLNVSRGTILANPIAGVGQGQFVIDMQKFAPKPLESWQFQPVHNVYLIIWSELGIIGLALFLLFVYNMFHVEQRDNKNVPRGTLMEQASFKYLQAVLIGFLFLMFWDHYSWDIQQGQAALWIVFGFVTGIKGSQYQKKK